MDLRVSAILLAAGRSLRMGQPKQIMPLRGKPFLTHCLDHLFAAGIEDVMVVLGAYRERVNPLVAHRPVTVVFNRAEKSEMVDSLRLGLSALSQSGSGVLVCLSDHPLVAAETYRRLADVHLMFQDKILVPAYEEKRGHPVLFPRPLVEQAYQGLHLRQIMTRNVEAVQTLAVEDPGILWDIDTMADYEMACRVTWAG